MGISERHKINKRCEKGKIDLRYYIGMSVVNWMDTKTVMIISTIDNRNTTNTVNFKRRKKGQEGKVDIKVSAMVQLYSKYKKGTDFLDQKTTVYVFDRKSLGYIISGLFKIILTWNW